MQGARNALRINLRQPVRYQRAGEAARAGVVAQKISFSSELLSLG